MVDGRAFFERKRLSRECKLLDLYVSWSWMNENNRYLLHHQYCDHPSDRVAQKGGGGEASSYSAIFDRRNHAEYDRKLLQDEELVCYGKVDVTTDAAHEVPWTKPLMV